MLIWALAVVFGIGAFASYKLYNSLRYDTHRPMISYVASQYTHPLRIAEIGVFYGTNARRMFKKLNVSKMYLIDPYQKYDDYGHEKKLMTFLPKSFTIAMKVLGKYAKHTIPLHMTSEQAASKIPDDLDMVYIDGNHAYDYVKKDIELYYPKVKTGGLIGGHDIDNTQEGVGVHQAVMEFIEKHNLTLHIDKPDWWIVKDT